MIEPINQLSNQRIHLLTVFWPHCYSAVNREKVMLIVQSFVPKHCVCSFSGTNHKLPHETFSIVTSVFLITVLSHAHYSNNMEPLVGMCPCTRPTDSCMLVWLSSTPSFDARTVNMALLTNELMIPIWWFQLSLFWLMVFIWFLSAVPAPAHSVMPIRDTDTSVLLQWKEPKEKDDILGYYLYYNEIGKQDWKTVNNKPISKTR